MKIGKLRLTHADKFVIAEAWILVIATILFLTGVYHYYVNYRVHSFIWGLFALFILAKNWLEFWETQEDRRVLDSSDEEMPWLLRKQNDGSKRKGDMK